MSTSEKGPSVRKVFDLLGYIQTWIWLYGLAGGTGIAVLIWGLASHLPAVHVFVLTLGAAVLCLIGLETSLVLYAKIKSLLGAKIRAAVGKLSELREEGTQLLNRMPSNGQDVNEFEKEYEADTKRLKRRALDAMRGVASTTQIAWFKSLVSWNGPGLPGISEKHTILRNTVNEMLNRMHQISENCESRL